MKFKIPRTPFICRIVDFLMIPIMYILGGFKLDSIQETHPWHSWRKFSEEEINIEDSVTITGTDNRTFRKHFLFLFHAPLFGGWKNYSVYSPVKSGVVFHIGWIVYENGSQIEAGINKLLIKNGSIRMLDGPPNYRVSFFGVDKDGSQIKIYKTGSGRLGDHKYPGIRLF